MRQGNHRNRTSADEAAEPAADQFLKPRLAQEPLDCQLADWNQHRRTDQREFLLQPQHAVGYLLSARFQVSPFAAARKALHHRSHVAE